MANLSELLEGYYPGKYDLHTRLEDFLAGLEGGRPSQKWLTPEEWKLVGNIPEAEALYWNNPPSIEFALRKYMTGRRTNPMWSEERPWERRLYSLDALLNMEKIKSNIEHELFHFYTKQRNKELAYEMAKYFPMSSEPAQALMKVPAYQQRPDESWEDYRRRLAGEYAARMFTGEMEPISPYWTRLERTLTEQLRGHTPEDILRLGREMSAKEPLEEWTSKF